MKNTPLDPARDVEQRRWLERRLGLEEGALDEKPIGPLPHRYHPSWPAPPR
jgi:hypothetical protein